MITYKGKGICYSFRYGAVSSKKFFRICAVFFLVYFIILFCVSIILIIQSLFSGPGPLVSICMFLFLAIGVFFIAIDQWVRRIERQYAIWILDENLVEVQTIPFEYSMCENRKKAYRFGVTFLVEDKEITKYSKVYDNFFSLHRNQRLNILYSPKYDEVMILKDE